MFTSDVSEELILLMRGFFSTPVISSLGKLGVIDAMLAKQRFAAADFSAVANQEALGKSFRYLSRLGLLRSAEPASETFELTHLGAEALKRHSSFYVPHSYLEYMHAFERLLKDPSLNLLDSVDRLENVIGSGLAHRRYFVPAISYLRRRLQFDILVDLGCGNGFFLREALKALPGTAGFGIDSSPVSVRATRESLAGNAEITTLCADAFDLESWAPQVEEVAGGRRIAFTMWFLLHEISQGRTPRVIEYFERIHARFPAAPIVFGELVRVPDALLAQHHRTSVMPEYLFFHDLSGQGILSWQEYQDVLKAIPFELCFDKSFDELEDAQGQYVPSAFVWGLTPR